MTTAAGEKTAPTCKLLTSLHITEFMFASETGSINAHIVGLNVHDIRLPIYWLVRARCCMQLGAICFCNPPS